MHGSFDMQHACDEADAREERELQARMMADLAAAVDAEKARLRSEARPPVALCPVFRPPTSTREQAAEDTEVEEHEMSGGGWVGVWAAQAGTRFGDAVRYRSGPGLDPRRGMRRD